MNCSLEKKDPGKSTVLTEISESRDRATTTQYTKEPPGIDIDKASSALEESKETPVITEIQKFTEKATTQDMEELSRTRTSRKSEDTEESGESTGTAKIMEFLGTATTKDMEGLSKKQMDTNSLYSGTSIIQESKTEHKMVTRETKTDATENRLSTQDLGIQTDNTLNRYMDTSVPVEDQSLNFFQILCYTFCFGCQRSATKHPPILWLRDTIAGHQRTSSPRDTWARSRCTLQLNGTYSEEQTGATGNKSEVNKAYEILQDTGEVSDEYDGKELKSFKEQIEKIREIILSTSQNWRLFQGSHTVGIFSRSPEDDYKWLMSQLKSEPFRSIVSTVLPHYISNNGRQQFMDAVSQCMFGILYHTKNRGRINITDVTDSLYDKELQYMSENLGKEKVIVLVDDLEDTSDEEKRQILKSQPKIETFARDLFLFNKNKI